MKTVLVLLLPAVVWAAANRSRNLRVGTISRGGDSARDTLFFYYPHDSVRRACHPWGRPRVSRILSRATGQPRIYLLPEGR